VEGNTQQPPEIQADIVIEESTQLLAHLSPQGQPPDVIAGLSSPDCAPNPHSKAPPLMQYIPLVLTERILSFPLLPGH